MDQVKELFRTHVEELLSIEKLSGGLSNDIYFINNKYVWKVFRNLYLIDHKNEVEVIKNIKEMNLYYNDNFNICFDYKIGFNIDKKYFLDNINVILQKLKDFHKLKIKNVKNFWYDIVPLWICQLPDDCKICSKKELNLMYKHLTNILKNISNEEDIVICHHDIHPGNIIIFNDNIDFIDLEFSFNNYYFIDIANILCEVFTDYDNEIYTYNKINEDKIKSFIKMYNQKENDLERIKVGIEISHFYWMIWGLLINFKDKVSKFDYFKFAKARYEFLPKL